MKILDFAFIIGKLKVLKRTGWVRENIPNPESVAEHSYRMALLAMIVAPNIGADVHKSIKMALIHDIAEAEIGDIVISRGKNTQNNRIKKHNDEREAFIKIFQVIGNEEYLDLYDEYDQNITKEAKLVKQLDKLEMAIQALEYEQKYHVDLIEFFENAESKIHDPKLKKIMLQIKQLRNNNTQS